MNTSKLLSFEKLHNIRYLFGADRDYIEEYYHTIDSKYGSFSRFLKDGLKLTENDIREFQLRYLR